MHRLTVLLGALLLLAPSAAADGPEAPPPGLSSPAALEIAAREAELAGAEARGDARAVAAAREALGDAVRRAGDVPRARKILGQARDEAKRLGDLALLASATANLSAACGAVGDIDEALRLGAEALALHQAQGSQANVAASLNNLGNLRNARGEYAEAREKHGEALAMWRAAGNRGGIAKALGNLGNDASKVGEYARALEHGEEALALLESLGDQGGIATQVASLSHVHRALGEAAKALERAEKALSMSEQAGDLPAVAELLGHIGSMKHATGDYEEAIAHFERELQIVERTGNQAEMAQVFCNLGTVRYSQGDWASAQGLLEKALALQTKLGLHSGAIHTRGNLGVVLFRRGLREEAAAALEAAVAEADRLRIDKALAASLGHLAGFRMETGDPAAALAAATRGAAVEARLVAGLGDEQGAFARQAHHAIYETGLLAAASLNDVDEAARFLELGRAGALREALLARKEVERAAIPADLAAAEAAARKAEAEAILSYRAGLEGGDRAEIRRRREKADAATAAVEAALDRIQRAMKRGATLDRPQVEDLAGLVARLSPTEAFITYSYAGPQALALVVTQRTSQFVGLGKVEAITRNCESLHADDPGTPIEEIAAAVGHIAGHLVRRYKLPDEVKRIYVSPEGVTGYVPFTLLFPGREIVYEPSFSTYGMLRDEARARGDKILALGDPDYSAGPAGGANGNPAGAPSTSTERSTRDGRGGRLVPLPATREEAKAIGDTVLLGREASESGLKAAIAAHSGRFRAIHFACHGLLDPDHPLRCALALTPSNKDDGFLTARELLLTPIPSDLVVLSACETAKGRVLHGEGILGLTRAFMYAGAPRVLCSLWKVDDEATRALMLEFYKRWKSGVPPATALLEAQAAIRAEERWKHPYYWAAWVLWGLPE